MPTAGDDERWMRMALCIGERGRGQSWPNPSVGCLLVKHGRVLARGVTGPGGRPHAEAIALERAGSAAEGSTAYVTLEPCAHTGNTPACAQLLATARVKRVVVAVEDPDPRVSGRGCQMLREAGITVRTKLLGAQARRAHQGFFLRVSENRPMLTLKLAMSFDGGIATADGESKWITGEAARRRVHLMRFQHDAVMVGSGTAAHDNPDLAPRALGSTPPKLRIVIDSRLTTSCDSQLGRTAHHNPVWLCHTPAAAASAIEAWNSRGAETIQCRAQGEVVDLHDCMRALAQRGLTRIFCEGGGRLAASLLQNRLVDDLVGFYAGLALGSDSHPAIADLGIQMVADAHRFKLVSTTHLGNDVMTHWRSDGKINCDP
ncbi:MAG: bifunctional diaminohydroxyphosphoribosylaminopyrimidine deaminase/5-amino-6-(5-phosphoribosylamino)uracil reductase RibD [Rhodobacteraceae bacterium]|nr:bifunctional diaminohydroxyphosphoribosylaminopyrimidine deaminase/5-amino-6-(5-phosphoribosylamino)uracil reductase RibD [Paracoccaceae bacterium]